MNNFFISNLHYYHNLILPKVMICYIYEYIPETQVSNIEVVLVVYFFKIPLLLRFVTLQITERHLVMFMSVYYYILFKLYYIKYIYITTVVKM